MKLEILLNETQIMPNNEVVSFSQLTPIQVHVLRKIADGMFDFDTAKQASQLAMQDLEDMGLVVSGEITPAGEDLVKVSNDEGMSSYTQLVKKRNAKLGGGKDFGARRTSEDDLTANMDDVTGGMNNLRF